MKALGPALMAAGVCLLAAVGGAVFWLAPRIFGRHLLDLPYSQFIAFVFGVALIASGAVFQRFNDIMKIAFDVARDVTRDIRTYGESAAAPCSPDGDRSYTTRGLKAHDKFNVGK